MPAMDDKRVESSEQPCHLGKDEAELRLNRSREGNAVKALQVATVLVLMVWGGFKVYADFEQPLVTRITVRSFLSMTPTRAN
jgi:hypothetical protein